jgi:hypothetical protein
MIEQNFSPNIEAEIAELTTRIEAKRRELEEKNNIKIDDKAVVQAVVTDFVSPPPSAPKTDNTDDSYLDNLPLEVETHVSELVEKVFDRGLGKTIAEARKLPAFDLDAFHDTLTDKIYNQLKNRGLVS